MHGRLHRLCRFVRNHTAPTGTSFLVEVPNSAVVGSDMIDCYIDALLAVTVTRTNWSPVGD